MLQRYNIFLFLCKKIVFIFFYSQKFFHEIKQKFAIREQKEIIKEKKTEENIFCRQLFRTFAKKFFQMVKIKTISRYTINYSRKSAFDSTIVEKKHQTSFSAYNENGNLILDKTFDMSGDLENCIKREYNSQNQIVKEELFDGIDENPYESRVNIYDQRGLVTISRVSYAEDEVEERFTYNADGNLLKKEVVYPDGDSYVEVELQWNGRLLQSATEYDDDGEENILRNYQYDQQEHLTEMVVEEKSLLDKHTETYEYEGDLITRQVLYNLKGKPVSITINIYDGRQLIGKTVETDSRYLKTIFDYDADGNKTRERIYNRKDVLLTDKIFVYNEKGLEIKEEITSRNIVDNNDEMELTEAHISEYEYWE